MKPHEWAQPGDGSGIQTGDPSMPVDQDRPDDPKERSEKQDEDNRLQKL
jgi:hypothetical protein